MATSKVAISYISSKDEKIEAEWWGILKYVCILHDCKDGAPTWHAAPTPLSAVNGLLPHLAHHKAQVFWWFTSWTDRV